MLIVTTVFQFLGLVGVYYLLYQYCPNIYKVFPKIKSSKILIAVIAFLSTFIVSIIFNYIYNFIIYYFLHAELKTTFETLMQLGIFYLPISGLLLGMTISMIYLRLTEQMEDQ